MSKPKLHPSVGRLYSNASSPDFETPPATDREKWFRNFIEEEDRLLAYGNNVTQEMADSMNSARFDKLLECVRKAEAELEARKDQLAAFCAIYGERMAPVNTGDVVEITQQDYRGNLRVFRASVRSVKLSNRRRDTGQLVIQVRYHGLRKDGELNQNGRDQGTVYLPMDGPDNSPYNRIVKMEVVEKWPTGKPPRESSGEE